MCAIAILSAPLAESYYSNNNAIDVDNAPSTTVDCARKATPGSQGRRPWGLIGSQLEGCRWQRPLYPHVHTCYTLQFIRQLFREKRDYSRSIVIEK